MSQSWCRSPSRAFGTVLKASLLVVPLPVPLDEEQRRLLQVVWDLFAARATWPDFGEVDRLLDRQAGLDAIELMSVLPSGLLHPPFSPIVNDNQSLRLTIAGAAACRGSAEDVSLFLSVVRLAATLERAWIGPPVEDSKVPRLTDGDVRRALVLPAAGREALLGRVGQLLIEESWGWRSAGAEGGQWDFQLGRSVRRFRNIKGLEDYWNACTVAVRGSSNDLLGNQEEADMAAPRIFISHASEDLALATLFRDSLLNAGVREDLIFYSGDRSSGVPTGTDIRTRLLEELRAPGLVVELLSPSFLASTWCLLEVGAAWGLGKSTYPIVVPPLALESAVAVVGQVQVGRLDTRELVEAVFDEFHERLESTFDVNVKATSWRRAVGYFVNGLDRALVSPSPPVDMSRASKKVENVSKRGVQVSGCVVLDGPYGREVHGEASNIDKVEHSASVKATFYDGGGRIVGTAEGAVSQLGPGETQTFTLTSLSPIPDHAEMKVRLDVVV